MLFGLLRNLVIIIFVLLSSPVLAGTPAGHPDDWNDAYDDKFRKYSERYFGPHFDWKWFKAQSIVESSLNYRAMSSSGAQGLMQILPSPFGRRIMLPSMMNAMPSLSR